MAAGNGSEEAMSDTSYSGNIAEVSQHGVLHVADFIRRPKW